MYSYTKPGVAKTALEMWVKFKNYFKGDPATV